MSGRTRFAVRVLRFVALLVAAVAVPTAARGLDLRADLTANGRLTLSRQTREVVTLVRRDLEVTAFFGAAERADERAFRELVAEYRRRNPKIRLRVVDPDRQPGLAVQFGLQQTGSIFVEYRDRRTEATVPAEIELTSAILRAVRPTDARVCFIAGHGEAALADDGPRGLSGLAVTLTANGSVVAEVSLLAGVGELEPCTIVVLAGPKVALLRAEVDTLGQWVERNGRLVVLVDPSSETALGELLEPWGIRPRQELVVDAGAALPGDPSTLVVSRFPSSSPITADVGRLLLAEAGWASVKSDERRGLSVAPLATASGGAEAIERSREPGQPGPRRSEPEPVLAAIADRSSVAGSGGAARIDRTLVVWVGDADFATNALVGEASNRRFLLAVLTRIGLPEDLIAIGGPAPDVRRLVLSDAQSNRVFTWTVVAAPLFLVIVGVLVRIARGRAGADQSSEGRARGD